MCFYWCNFQEYPHLQLITWSKSLTTRILPFSVGKTFLREADFTAESPSVSLLFPPAGKSNERIIWILLWSPFGISSVSKRWWLKLLLRQFLMIIFYYCQNKEGPKPVLPAYFCLQNKYKGSPWWDRPRGKSLLFLPLSSLYGRENHPPRKSRDFSF